MSFRVGYIKLLSLLSNNNWIYDLHLVLVKPGMGFPTLVLVIHKMCLREQHASPNEQTVGFLALRYCVYTRVMVLETVHILCNLPGMGEEKKSVPDLSGPFSMQICLLLPLLLFCVFCL